MKSFRHVSSLVIEGNLGFNFNVEEFAWAWFTVNTRAVYFENSLRGKRTEEIYKGYSNDADQNLALAPFLDMFNHCSTANVEAGYNLSQKISKTGYEIITNTECHKYDQVFINYGPHGNLRLYTEYGFAEENNPNDFVPVILEEIKQIFFTHHDLLFQSGLVEKALKIVQKNKLHENLRICSNGPSWNIAASFFVLNSVYFNGQTATNNPLPGQYEWQNVFMIEDFSNHIEVSSQLLMLIKVKLKEVARSVSEIGKKLGEAPHSVTTKRHVLSNSLKMAQRLLNLHQSILKSAVKCLAKGA